jgi:hypothetical protein
VLAGIVDNPRCLGITCGAGRRASIARRHCLALIHAWRKLQWCVTPCSKFSRRPQDLHSLAVLLDTDVFEVSRADKTIRAARHDHALLQIQRRLARPVMRVQWHEANLISDAHKIPYRWLPPTTEPARYPNPSVHRREDPAAEVIR